MTISERDILLAEVKRQMDNATEEHHKRFEEMMFRDAPCINYLKPKIKPLPSWKKVYYNVRAYFRTLWLAIKGTELELPYED